MAKARSTPSKKIRAQEGRRPKKNPLKVAGIETVDYKDVNTLRTFISDRGKIRSRCVTGLTPHGVSSTSSRALFSSVNGQIVEPPVSLAGRVGSRLPNFDGFAQN